MFSFGSSAFDKNEEMNNNDVHIFASLWHSAKMYHNNATGCLCCFWGYVNWYFFLKHKIITSMFYDSHCRTVPSKSDLITGHQQIFITACRLTLSHSTTTGKLNGYKKKGHFFDIFFVWDSFFYNWIHNERSWEKVKVICAVKLYLQA